LRDSTLDVDKALQLELFDSTLLPANRAAHTLSGPP